ncbi:hypothetical protein KSP40_PGU007556 [Platanthera guangdongensis]|uniref:Uncharacterized protein n=1 Tax=Platanthera guangdongensis TaxID=2320717 RepID=A0ABR2N0L9_9ASPA
MSSLVLLPLPDALASVYSSKLIEPSHIAVQNERQVRGELGIGESGLASVGRPRQKGGEPGPWTSLKGGGSRQDTSPPTLFYLGKACEFGLILIRLWAARERDGANPENQRTLKIRSKGIISNLENRVAKDTCTPLVVHDEEPTCIKKARQANSSKPCYPRHLPSSSSSAIAPATLSSPTGSSSALTIMSRRLTEKPLLHRLQKRFYSALKPAPHSTAFAFFTTPVLGLRKRNLPRKRLLPSTITKFRPLASFFICTFIPNFGSRYTVIITSQDFGFKSILSLYECGLNLVRPPWLRSYNSSRLGVVILDFKYQQATGMIHQQNFSNSHNQKSLGEFFEWTPRTRRLASHPLSKPLPFSGKRGGVGGGGGGGGLGGAAISSREKPSL